MTPKPLRILLIEPPYYRLFKDTFSLSRYPLALGYLAGTIKRETAWSVLAYNSDFYPNNDPISTRYLTGPGFDRYLANLQDLSAKPWREIAAVIAEYQPAVVGISAKSQNFASACLVAKLAKKHNQETVVVVGGPHPSMVGAAALDNTPFDVCVKGEGERTIVELLAAIESGGSLAGLQGIAFRKDGQVIDNGPRPFIGDLDALCFPHESAPELLRDYRHYPLSAFSNIFTTRGCPYDCSFCGSRQIWSRKVRFRSPANVLAEIKGLVNKGLRAVHFDDDTFGIDKQQLHELCAALATHCPGLQWSCELHVKLVDDQTIAKMKAAGCQLIQVGVESGNNQLLQQIKKHSTIEEAQAACQIIKRHGISVQAFFMVGFPQETEETLNDTIAAMKKIAADSLVYSIFTPYPGTEAFELCRENGLIGEDYDVSLYNHQSPRNYFCREIPAARFRSRAALIEKMVDRKNHLNRVREVFSWSILWRLKELGLRRSLHKGLKLFFSR